MFEKIPEPKTERSKTFLAKKLYEEFKSIRDAKDRANWEEGRLLYFFEKYDLQNYLFGKPQSKKAFYTEIDVPLSTAAFKVSIYDFYVVQNGFSYKDLKDANTKKLHRAIPFIRGKAKDEIRTVIGYAEREREGLNDFLALIGGKDQYNCTHEHTRAVTQDVCGDCGKKIKGVSRAN